MTKEKFLDELRLHLARLPEEERTSAVQYYTMYFDDAGPECEQDVLQELGSPQKVAQEILAESGDGQNNWTPPEKVREIRQELEPEQQAAAGHSVPSLELTPSPLQEPGKTPPPQAEDASPQQPVTALQPVRPARKNDNLALWIVLLVVLSPILFSLLGVVVSLIASAFCILIIPFIIGVSFFLAGLACCIVSIYLFIYTIPNGLFMLGAGIVIAALGLLSIRLGVWIFKKVLPSFFGFIKKIFRKVFPAKQEVQA